MRRELLIGAMESAERARIRLVQAWKLEGDFPDTAEFREVVREAQGLLQDAQVLLRGLIPDGKSPVPDPLVAYPGKG